MRDVVRIYIFFFSFFLDTLFCFVHRSCDHLVIVNIVLIYFIYMMMMLSFHLSLHVWFLFSLYTHVSIYVCNLIFLFHIKMPWWVLFKVFQKDRLSKSIMSWTLFLQNFSRVCVRIRFYYTKKSDYEFSDLWLLSYFICLLWFCHGLAKGEIVRTYVKLVKNICHVELANHLTKRTLLVIW